LKLARSLVAGRSRPRIVLVTDRPLERGVDSSRVSDGPVSSGPQGERPARRPAATEERVVRVGRPVNNAAIVSAQFEPDGANPLAGRFGVRVAYSGEKPAQVNVVVQRAGGAPLLNAAETFAPGSTRDFGVSGVPADGDRLVVRLGPGDAVAADNSVRFHLPLRTPIRAAVNGELPELIGIALKSDPAVRLVAAGEAGDIDVLVNPASGATFSRPALILRSDGSALAPEDRGPIAKKDRSSLTEGLDFEGAVCGEGSMAGPGAILTCGQHPVAALDRDGKHQQLTLASAFWTGNAPRKAAFAIFISRGVRKLAGWDEDPVVLAPERAAEDPLWKKRENLGGEMVVMPVGREAADLSREGIPAGGGDEKGFSYQRSRWGAPAMFEVFLILAIAFFLVEAFLHARGRIS
jgi:hypothetical protein